MRRVSQLRTTAAVALALEFLLPWAETGHRARSGYNLAGVLHQSGLITQWFASGIIVSVFLLPLLAGLTIAADIAQLPRVAAMSLSCAVAITLICAAAILLTGLGNQIGPRLAGASCVAIVAVSLVVVARSRTAAE